ncbi:ACP S-malonyltransferase [Photobacterium sp. TY1-4]|nr:ACP S-malonyltransferase [Photobacterium sp. TY1-4]
MGKELFDKYAVVRETFAESSDVLAKDIADLCFNASPDVLMQTENAQAAILTLNVAFYRLFHEEYGVTPTLVAGHSLGEYAALVAGDVLDFADALRLVDQRATLMAQAAANSEGGMLAVIGADDASVARYCEQVSTPDAQVTPANINAGDQIIVSGAVTAIEALQAELELLGIKNQRLKVSGAFHSPLMQPAADRFAQEIEKYSFREPAVSVISNVTGQPYESASEIKRLLVEQLVQPVCWKQTMDFVQQACVSLALELGPGSVLKKLAKHHVAIETLAFDLKSDREQLGSLLMNRSARAQFNQDQQINVLNKCMAVAVSTRNTNDDLKAYEQGVVQPYNQLKALHEAGDVSPETARSALGLLKTILDTKGVSALEQKQRFQQIADEVQLKTLITDFSVAEIVG